MTGRIASILTRGLEDEVSGEVEATIEGRQKPKPKLRRPLLTIDAWMADKYYCGNLVDAPQSIRDRVRAGCVDGISRVMLGGAVGTYKTTVVTYVGLWELFKISCWEDPGAAYGQAPGEKLYFLFVSRDYEKAKDIPFARFVQYVQQAKYFGDHFPMVAGKEEATFHNGEVIALPVATTEESVISYTVVFFYMDESEHMRVTKNSRLTRGLGKEYDQADAVAGEGQRRMMSRMWDGEKTRGKQAYTSSPKYPNSFLQRQIRLAKMLGENHTYVSEMSLWEAQRGVLDTQTGKPRFSDENTPEGGFSVEIGDADFLSRILEPGEEPRKGAVVRRVPVELRNFFDPKKGGNLEEAIRDLMGLPMLSVDPLITDRAGLAECVRLRNPAHADGCECDTCVLALNPWSTEETFLDKDVEFLRDRLCVRDEEDEYVPRVHGDAPRVVHIDGAFDTNGGDAMGFTMGHGFDQKMLRKLGADQREEIVPQTCTWLDLILRIRRPPAAVKLEWDRVADLLLYLRDRCGFRIEMVTMDTFQSEYFLQRLERFGFRVSNKMSMDKDVRPYLLLRDAISARAISMYHHEALLKELLSLEFDRRYRKVDHPAGGTKDIADSVAGVHYICTKFYSEFSGWDAPVRAVSDMSTWLGSSSTGGGDASGDDDVVIEENPWDHGVKGQESPEALLDRLERSFTEM